jgi:hypothetical protein
MTPAVDAGRVAKFAAMVARSPPAELKKGIRVVRPNAEQVVPRAVDIAVSPVETAAAPARKSSNSSPRLNLAPAPLEPTPVKVSAPPAPPKPAKKFPLSVNNGTNFDVPDGIIAHLTRDCGGNEPHLLVLDVRSGRATGRLKGRIRTRDDMITMITVLRRMLLIWQLTRFSFPLLAKRTKELFRTPETTVYVAISRKEQLSQLTVQCARMNMFRAVFI